MKIKNLNSFKEAAKEALVALVMAEDRADQNRALATLKGESALFRMQGAEFSKERFVQETEQVDLFAKRRLVVVEEAHLLKKEDLSLIGSYAEKPNQNVTLLLLASTNIGAPKLVQQIDTKGVILSLLEEKSWDKKGRLVHEAIHYLQEEGVKIEPGLCAHFIAAQGLEQATIKQELDKLLCYIGERKEVTKEDIAAIGAPQHTMTIWNLVDAILERKSGPALTIGKELLSESSLYYILATLRSQIRSGIEILTVYEQQGRAAVTKRFPYLKGNLLDKKLSLLTRYGLESLTEAMQHFFAMEVQLREGTKDEEFVLELLLIGLCRC